MPAGTSVIRMRTVTRCGRLPSLSLRRILHFAVAERPVFTICVDQADPDILLSNMSLLVDLVSDPAEEFLLHVDRTPADPGELYDDEVACIVQAEITLFRVYDFVGSMTRYYLKLVVHRYIGDLNHGMIDPSVHCVAPPGRRLSLVTRSGQ